MVRPVVADKGLIETIFDGAASNYDRIGPRFFRALGARLVEMMGLAKGARLLDIGTGTGAVLIPGAQAVGPEGSVIGIDLSNEMLGEAERAARAAGVSVQLGKMDAEALEFSDRSFDAATFGFSVFFCPSMERALREAYRVLVEDGAVGLTVWSKSPPPFDPAWKLFADMVRSYDVEVRMPQKVAFMPEEIDDLLSRVGFAERVITTEPHQFAFVTEDEWWTFQMTNGSRAAILRLFDERRAEFKKEYLTRLDQLSSSKGLVFPATVIFATARKPRQVA